MKKVAVFVLAMLCVVALVGCSPAYAEESTLLKEGTVKRVSVTSRPEGYDYSYTGDILHIAIDGLSVDFKPKSEDEFVSEGFEVQGNIMYHAKAERIYDQQTIEEFEQQRVLINN